MGKRHRNYSSKLKFQAVLEVLTGARTPAQVAKAYGVHPNSVTLWKKAFLERGPEMFERENKATETDRRIGDLEQLLGRKEVEIAFLKNFLGRRA
jgi:transposase